jgi:predicted nucleic acid-binding protein
LGSLIDTNVISEYRNPHPDAGVIGFLRGLDFRTAYLSVVTLSEIRFGVDRLPKGLRRRQLDHWLTWDLPLDFQDRILLVSDPIAQAAGALRAKAMAAGRPMGAMDAFIAATAEVHGLTLVSRNTRDFEVWAGPLLNPWSADAG